MAGPNWTLDDDRKTVTVTFPTIPPVALKLSVQQVDEMLRNLGGFRANMEPAVPTDFALGQVVLTVTDPIWRTEPDAMTANTLLHLRDPRFGWFHYMIPKAEADKMAKLISAQVAVPADLPPGGKAN